jgi:glyoxylase-like metal-dependent hydrolase (beta-lactamase superfamily II)
MTEWTIGDVRITRVEELAGPFFVARDFFPQYDEAVFKEHEHWLAPDWYAPDIGMILASVHCWVVRTGGYTVLIDTCTGNGKRRETFPPLHMLSTPWLDRLAAAGVQPEDVDFVMCTHFHFDHVGWNTRLDNGKWVPTFPKAKYLMPRGENDFWAQVCPTLPENDAMVCTYNDSVLPIIEAKRAELVDGDAEILPGFKLHPTPGHSPGQVRIDVSNGGKRGVFAGDVLHSPLQVHLPDWSTSFCVDGALSARTRRELLAHAAEHDAMVLPAHFAAPHALHVKARGDKFFPDFERVPR